MSEERGFEVVDKRGAAPPEETAAAEPEAPDAPKQASEEDAGADEPLDFSGFNPFAGITVAGILQMSAGLLSERAWIDMGMVADPGTGQVEKRLDEAKRAIDALTDISRHLEPVAGPDERRELQTMLTNLRLNFVRQRDAG